VKDRVLRAWKTTFMSNNYSHSDLFLEAAQVFHWATKRHFQLWFTGRQAKRHRRTEVVLRRLSERKKLRLSTLERRWCMPCPGKRRTLMSLK